MTVQPTRKFTRKLITALLAACILPVALPMLPADAAPGYKPPRRQSAKRTENSGTRNQLSRIGDLKDCAKDLAVPLALVVPEEQKTAGDISVTPETTLEKPALHVYLAAPNKTLRISLNEGRTPVWKEPNIFPVKDSGITEIPYPDNRKGLEVGKTYTWKVEIVCELDTVPSGKQVGSRVTRVPAPWTLQRQLKTTTSPRQRAEIYANAGFWSETLMSIAEAQQDSTDTAADQDLLALLEQVDLKSIADRERDSSPTPAPKPVITPSPAAAVTPAPTPMPAVTPKPTDPKKPCK
jgi:Domain of Unknown Function (DUF928)